MHTTSRHTPRRAPRIATLLSLAALTALPAAAAATTDPSPESSAAAALLANTPATFTYAQPVNQREAEPTARPVARDLRISLRGEGEVGMSSDFKAGEGDIQVSRVRADLGVGVPIGDRSNIDISFDNEWSFYDFSEPNAFGAQSPWDDVWERGLRIMFSTQETERLAWYLGADITASGEYGADFGDSLTYGGIGGVRYAFSDSFTAGLGVFVRSRLEDDALFIPAFAFLWNISDQWSLSSQNGLTLKLSYKATEALNLFLEGGYESREFRLDDEGIAPDGIGKDRRVPIALGAQYRFSPAVSLTGKAGAYAWQRYRLDDEEGAKIAEYEADPAAFFTLELRVTF